MAEEEGAQDKSLEPSEKKRRDFRNRGEVPKSAELASALGICTGVGVFFLSLNLMLEGFSAIFHGCFDLIAVPDVDGFDYEELLGVVVPHMGRMIFVPLGALWFLSLILGLIQSQGATPEDPIKLDWSRVDPLANGKRLYFSSQPFMEGFKGISKLFVLLWLCLTALKPHLQGLPVLVYGNPAAIFSQLQDLAGVVLSRVIPFALLIGILDFAYQWYRLEQKMMMSPQEMKDEQRDSDGDPHVRAHRRRRQREIAFGQSLQDIRHADVIVTNPTHYAVALRYNKAEAPAPVVVCKGVDHLAERIKAEARRHDVPTVENRAVARALYAQCKVGEMIPETLYSAVATVLAMIFRRRSTRIGM
jgi:flagellar biosynthesis protein FlhB